MIKSHKYVKTETLDNLISKYSTLVYDTESKLYGSLNAEKNIFDKFGAIRTVIASSGPIGLCVEIAMALGNVFFNISEQCEYAIRTYGAATISILLVNDFDDKIKGFDRNNNYYIISNNNNIRTYFAKLAYSRINAEETYIKFREYAPGDSFNSERTYSEKVITYIKNNILGERNE